MTAQNIIHVACLTLRNEAYFKLYIFYGSSAWALLSSEAPTVQFQWFQHLQWTHPQRFRDQNTACFSTILKPSFINLVIFLISQIWLVVNNLSHFSVVWKTEQGLKYNDGYREEWDISQFHLTLDFNQIWVGISALCVCGIPPLSQHLQMSPVLVWWTEMFGIGTGHRDLALIRGCIAWPSFPYKSYLDYYQSVKVKRGGV